MQAIHEVTALARFTFTVLAAKETHSNALPHFPFGNAWANRFNAAYYLMSRHSRQCQAWKLSFDSCGVGMTYTA
jgi:hypothetical protein